MLANTLYFDRTHGCDAVKILPGQYYVSDKNILIGTVLGSCVSACIRDRVAGIGGMNHFMLPDSGDVHNPISESARYGAYAMELLINQLMKMGAVRGNLEAKIFGGGNVLQNFSTLNVGERNAIFVKDYLSNEGIRVLSEDLMDSCARKVYFFPQTGRVLVKRLATIVPSIVNIEKDYAGTFKQKDQHAGDIDLF
ncbi:chemoreceptor glutamine deamidase CheD [Candidatus Methylospira mobilis]|uniref:Probable chemoreceptor glutamine deamidase CheD n=1 Tax=Candidatus Methylospira mobilis TaxID=1808979 RepID=A0A5Q0BJW2_9GAMM|nr:chemoreceptor glutamine deamidase CheD [Candidatus Methylospira mobilis]QFY42448.1 chemoreceptor glutamine deamidase CheD [Candidatus Methylospira mobilis]